MGDADSTQTLVGDDTPRRFGPRSPAAAAGLERFTILKKLGEGGMGSVYAAYDSTLDRRVAIKIVRRDRRTARAEEPDSKAVTARDQLLREAQAMARLSHPNVVAVHEVGEIGDDVFVVLELVDGTTLYDWLKERARPWREIVAAFVQAGRGLAAAHEAGLVHRDFKPTNVLVRRDGRIQVGDFGVVSMSGSSDPVVAGELGPAPSDITFVGSRVGTLAYMPPEQYAGSPVDGRADQFAFCVALWEALFGARPFAGEGAALAEAIRAHAIVAPTKGPRWLEVPLRRGLAASADARYPAMDELLAAISHDPELRRRRIATGLGAGAVVGGLALWAYLGWARQPAPIEPCSHEDAALAGRWDATRRAAVQAAFATSHLPYATTASAHAVARLDGWATQWAGARAEACRATRVAGVQSEALLDARERCLDRQLDDVDQLAAALVTTDRDVIARAGEALALPDLGACADPEYVTARVPPPGTPAARAAVEGVEHALAIVRAQARTGRYHAARVQAAAVAADAARTGFAPLVADALLVRGEIEEQDGDLVAARATLAAAARAAGEARDDVTLARALLSLLQVLIDRAELPAALALGVAADAAVARAHDADQAATLAEVLGNAHDAAGDGEAEAYLRRALAAREALAAKGEGAVAVAQLLNKLAGIAARGQRTDEARTTYARALAIVTEELGPDHPATAITRANACYLDAQVGRLAEARACQEQVLAILERALGADHPQVAWALNEVALVQRDQGELEGAAARFERALAIWERASGADHPDVAYPLVNLGEIAIARGDLARAERACTRALAILERAVGADHADTVPARGCLAQAAVASAPRAAIAHAEKALAITAAKGGARDPDIVFALARALAAVDEPARARSLAREAEGLARDGSPQRATIAAWLRAHR